MTNTVSLVGQAATVETLGIAISTLVVACFNKVYCPWWAVVTGCRVLFNLFSVEVSVKKRETCRAERV